MSDKLGPYLVDGLLRGLSGVLQQALETREARKRYDEYFSKQEEADRKRAQDQSSLAAQKAQLGREAKEREVQAAKEKRFAGPALGYLDPSSGEFHLGFAGGAPEGAQNIYKADVGTDGVGAVLREGIKKEAPKKAEPKSYGSLGLTLKESLSLAKAGNEEYAGLLGVSPKKSGPVDDVPEANQRGTYYDESIRRSGTPSVVTVGTDDSGKPIEAPATYPFARAPYDSLAPIIGAPAAFQRVLEQGLFDQPVITGGFPPDFVKESPVYAKGGKLYVRNDWLHKDEEVDDAGARNILREKGYAPGIINAYLKQIIGTEQKTDEMPSDGVTQDDLDNI